MQVLFGEYAPDIAPFNPAAIEVAENVIPQLDGYGSFPKMAAYASALAAQPQGFFFATASDGSIEIFSASATALYKLDKTNLTWDTVSRSSPAYTGDATDGWWFAQFGDRVIAVNQNDEPQYFDIGTSSLFADLPGSPPKAKRVAVVGDFVVLYALADDPNAVRWSGLNDSETWTLTQKSADIQSFPDGGEVQFIAPAGQGAMVIQKRRRRRMTFIPGSPLVFQFDTVEGARGAVSARSCVKVGSDVFFLADDGFYQAQEGGDVPIGEQKVNKTFLDTVDKASIPSIQGAVDIVRSMVIWRYSETTSASTDKALCYHYRLGKWSTLSDVTMYWFGNTATPETTLEALDSLYASIDDIPISLDSPIWAGGRPVFAAFDNTYKLSFFEGNALEAKVESADLKLIQGKECFVGSYRPIVDAATVYGTIATRKGYANPKTWKTEKTMRASGRITGNASGYTHRFRIRIPEDETWDTLQGVDIPDEEISAEGSW